MRTTALTAALALTACLISLPASAAHSRSTQQPKSADVIVYGATASGVLAAYTAAREGLHVTLLEPGQHVGGMVTGGLSATDTGEQRVIGGYVRDYYLRAADHYGIKDLGHHMSWKTEPHVGESLFRTMLTETNVDVEFNERLEEHGGVSTRNRRITSVTTQDGKHWSARVFIDCSYEGDLMAQSGVAYTYGRESAAEFEEGLAGVRLVTPKHNFKWAIYGFDSKGKPLPQIQPGSLAPNGSADQRVQAYNFRVILTQAPERMAFTKPEHYDPAQFALLARFLAEFPMQEHRPPTFRDLVFPHPIQGNKVDINNNGPFSTDYIGHSWKYPEASYADKARIVADHLQYTQGFFYFLSQDPSVPRALRAEVNSWGLPPDEFLDNNHWPNQLYIREGRRMRGLYVMRQSDLQVARTKPDSIGMGSYNSDSHNIQRITRPDGTVTNEGDVQVPVQPYEIPYRAMLPKELDNLIVPVCLSATHVAYSSLRMEPQYMILGQAAGAAAALAIRNKQALAAVPIDQLQQKLHATRAILHLDEAK